MRELPSHNHGLVEGRAHAQSNLEALRANSYPGRGIVIGFNSAGTKAFEVYWVMGRSDDSRNRELAMEGDVVKTVLHDPSKVKEGQDTSLILYNAMRMAMGAHVVSNGNQTDTAVEALLQGGKYDAALLTRTFEPDPPTNTSRITGILFPEGPDSHFVLSTIKKDPDTAKPVHVFHSYDMHELRGYGKVIHTYQEDAEKGKPLPQMKGKPYTVPLDDHIGDVASTFWQALNPDNRVAMVVKGIDLTTGEPEYHIINKLAPLRQQFDAA